MGRFVFVLIAMALLTAVSAQAAGLAEVVRQVDRQAVVERDGSVYIVVTSAQRITPHDAPYTEIIKALCAERDVLIGVERVVVLNSHAFKGVSFWTYDDHDDLVGACEAMDGGLAAGFFAVME